MILVRRRPNMISLSQFIPINIAADWFDEQHPMTPFRDVWVLSETVPHRPDVFGSVVPVIVVVGRDSPFVGFKTEQVTWVFLPTIIESGQYLLRRDVSVAWVSREMSVAPHCFTEATPTDRTPVRFAPEKSSLVASFYVSSQQCVSDP